jgi:hypothetical protein
LRDRLTDIAVRSEGMKARMAAMLPFWSYISAHTGYWTNPVVIKETTKLICEVIGP